MFELGIVEVVEVAGDGINMRDLELHSTHQRTSGA